MITLLSRLVFRDIFCSSCMRFIRTLEAPPRPTLSRHVHLCISRCHIFVPFVQGSCLLLQNVINCHHLIFLLYWQKWIVVCIAMKRFYAHLCTIRPGQELAVKGRAWFVRLQQYIDTSRWKMGSRERGEESRRRGQNSCKLFSRQLETERRHYPGQTSTQLCVSYFLVEGRFLALQHCGSRSRNCIGE